MHRGRDEKGLISWNSLVLAAFAEAGRVLDRADCRRVAGGLADAMIAHFCAPAGFLDPSDG
jgi:uncharacterized protein YyaL (SSP411 family)